MVERLAWDGTQLWEFVYSDTQVSPSEDRIVAIPRLISKGLIYFIDGSMWLNQLVIRGIGSDVWHGSSQMGAAGLLLKTTCIGGTGLRLTASNGCLACPPFSITVFSSNLVRCCLLGRWTMPALRTSPYSS